MPGTRCHASGCSWNCVKTRCAFCCCEQPTACQADIPKNKAVERTSAPTPEKKAMVTLSNVGTSSSLEKSKIACQIALRIVLSMNRTSAPPCLIVRDEFRRDMRARCTRSEDKPCDYRPFAGAIFRLNSASSHQLSISCIRRRPLFSPRNYAHVAQE